MLMFCVDFQLLYILLAPKEKEKHFINLTMACRGTLWFIAEDFSAHVDAPGIGFIRAFRDAVFFSAF